MDELQDNMEENEKDQKQDPKEDLKLGRLQYKLDYDFQQNQVRYGYLYRWSSGWSGLKKKNGQERSSESI